MLSLFFILPSLLSLYFFPASLSSLPPGIYKGKTEKRGLLPLSSHGTRVGWSNSPQAAARKACPRVRVWASGGGGEREGSIAGERNFFFSCLYVSREKRRPTVPIASPRATSMAIFIVYLFNLGVTT
jgi:hypothetical protein